MKCPHCLVTVHDAWSQTPIVRQADSAWIAVHMVCPSCHRAIIKLARGATVVDQWGKLSGITGTPREVTQAVPHGSGRAPCPPEVAESLAADYREACLVLPDSPKASAALSRRCLQHLLREYAHVKPNDLAREIQELLDRGTLPSQLAEAIDAIRNIGNFAAHPLKSTSTGEILPVEPGEAEWNLDVLESAFDFYFVQPRILKEKRDALNKKLADAKKPPLR